MTANDNKPSAKPVGPRKNERPCPICGKPRSERFEQNGS
jgi:CRISPR/Cas system-associated protein Cas10 (large subunit of type III CRISPR-Cas system)